MMQRPFTALARRVNYCEDEPLSNLSYLHIVFLQLDSIIILLIKK